METWLHSIILAAVRAGVRDWCVAAGARNAPLLAVLHALEQQGMVTLWPFFEERDASFFALGRFLSSGHPAAVVTTSGTAVAECFPAVIEAHHQGNPLLILSADRPRRFRGSGAPQSIHQPGIFGTYVAACLDLEQGETLPDHFESLLKTWNQPLHVNVCLEEPVWQTPSFPASSQEELPLPFSFPEPSPAEKEALIAFLEESAGAGKSLGICVSGLYPALTKGVSDFLNRIQVPIYAESTANVPSGPWEAHQIHGEREWMRTSFTHVLRLGSVPSGRWWRDLETKNTPKVFSVSRAPYSGLARESGLMNTDPTWLAKLILPAQTQPNLVFSQNSDSLQKLLKFPQSEIALLSALEKQIPKDIALFLGNSMPIREWNLLQGCLKTNPPRQIYANRGANGIDGQLSTFFGIAADQAEAWGIFGDLTTLYNLASPAILEHLPHTKIRLVVINNQGGRIFKRVAAYRGAEAPVMANVENVHGQDFQKWAEWWGFKYHRGQTVDEVNALTLHETSENKVLIELAPNLEATEAFWREWNTVQETQS